MKRSWIGLIAAGIGVLVIGCGVAAGSGSPRAWLQDNCRATGPTRDANGNRADAFACPQPPTRTAAALADAHPPADRQSGGTGHFLRYSDTMVGVLGAQQGSRVLLARERDGYGYFFPYVGGFWGSTSTGGSFRGGGPSGGGK
ncbi:MAG TPA: DUF4247 domain-containing protein [Solirubrobacteraceae bacterium]|nr:DUF4247 domain-containing protein [Solirubrobacteraceae bacterium]